MARVITAGRADTCRAGTCTAPDREIATGERINYGGPGAVSHEACTPVEAPRGQRRRKYHGSKYAYTSTGARMTMSSRRCEDAPCCGCCD